MYFINKMTIYLSLVPKNSTRTVRPISVIMPGQNGYPRIWANTRSFTDISSFFNVEIALLHMRLFMMIEKISSESGFAIKKNS